MGRVRQQSNGVFHEEKIKDLCISSIFLIILSLAYISLWLEARAVSGLELMMVTC